MRRLPWLDAFRLIATRFEVGMVFFGLGLIPLGLPKELVLYILVGASLLVCLARQFTRRELRVHTNIFTWLTLLFSGGILIAVTAGNSPGRSWFGTPDTFVLHATLLFAWLLWFWLVVHAFSVASLWQWGWKVLLSALALTLLLFWANGAALSPFTNTPSVLAVLAAVTLVGFIGTWLYQSTWPGQIWAGIGAAISCATLVGLGLGLGWIVAAAGLALLLAAFLWQRTAFTQGGLVGLLVTLFLAVWWAITGSPLAWRQNVPTEISLGLPASWQIMREVAAVEPLQTFFGQGLGNFVFTFAHYRPAAFNMTDFAADIYFNAPYSTIFVLLVEQGWLGVVLYAALIVVLLSYAPFLWRRAPRWQQLVSTHPNLLQTLNKWSDQPAVGLVSGGLQMVESRVREEQEARWHTLVSLLLSALLTAAFTVIFFDGALWWLWWTLLGFTVSGLAGVRAPLHAHTWSLSLQLSPAYLTLVRFGYGVAFFIILYIAQIFWINWRAADATPLARSESALAQAVTYSAQNPPAVLDLEKALTTATEAAKQATELEPDNFAAWRQLGMVYLTAAPVVAGADVWAVTALEEAHRLAPTNYSVEWQLAQAYAHAKRDKDAENAYKTTIQLKPDFIPAYGALSEWYENKQEFDKAIAVYEPAWPYAEKNAEALFRLGRLFFNRARVDDLGRAEMVWQRAVALQPNFSNAYYSLGLLYEKQGKRVAALEQYRKVLALNPENVDVKAKIRNLSGALR